MPCHGAYEREPMPFWRLHMGTRTGLRLHRRIRVLGGLSLSGPRGLVLCRLLGRLQMAGQ